MANRGTGSTGAALVTDMLDNFLESRALLARVVGRIVRPEEVEDIVQETFVVAYAASCGQEIRYPRAFMLRVARNIALDHVGRKEYRAKCSLEALDDGDWPAHAESAERRWHSEAEFLDFCHALAALPPACRRVFILKKVYGLSLAEISERLGISASTVEKHVAKGLAGVLEAMRRRGHGQDADCARRSTREEPCLG